jgi:hypothetical protein
MGEGLEKLVREAREHLGSREVSELDWASVDRALASRLEGERQAYRSRRPAAGWRRALLPGGLALSAAAVALFVVRMRPEPAPAGSPVGDAETPGDGVSIDPGGQALVQGVASSGDHALHVGDVIEAGLAPVSLHRPGKVAMTLEASSRARVSKMGETLVLELQRGAIEAQVTPVPHGEAFAVDVEGSRVAVHGTHLRVRRDDWRVVVDVNEGVIAVGEAPRVGPVLGAVVVASAHAEFMAFDPLGTLKVSREPSALRWPAPPRAPVPAETDATPEGHPGVEASSPHPPSAPTGEPRNEAHASAPPPATSGSAAAREAEVAALRALVRQCMAERPRAENVTILVNTTLSLTLGDDGWVQSARFDPPVAPDVNACAAQSIYRTHFDHGGNVTLAVDFKN